MLFIETYILIIDYILIYLTFLGIINSIIFFTINLVILHMKPPVEIDLSKVRLPKIIKNHIEGLIVLRTSSTSDVLVESLKTLS